MCTETDIIYSYDGTFDGLLCCVYECCVQNETPVGLVIGEPDQFTFSQVREIVTDCARADALMDAAVKKMGKSISDFTRKAFLSDLEHKDMFILKFFLMGRKYGIKTMYMISDPIVNTLFKAVQRCEHEAHLLLGFVRFSDTGDGLSAIITPKCKVLPIMARHFTDRYRNEKFLIYDKTNRMALIYADHRTEFLENVDFEPPETTPEKAFTSPSVLNKDTTLPAE